MITTRVHGILDYLVGIVLIAAPWLLGFAAGGAETWIPVLLGAGVIVYSLITDYEFGAMRIMPMSVHLTVDVIGGMFLAVSPWLFGYATLVWAPHVIVGLLMIGSGLLTQRVPRDRVDTHHHEPAPSHAHR